MVGASTSFFLLERSRVVQFSPGEQNFHVLHQLQRQDEADEAKDPLGWTKERAGKEYTFLRAHVDSQVNGEIVVGGAGSGSGGAGAGGSGSGSGSGYWGGEWDETSQALCAIGLDAYEMLQVKHILRTVMLLGNLRFGAESIPATKGDTQHKAPAKTTAAAAAAAQRESTWRVFGGGAVGPGE
jgi:myosin heavy subunit